MTLDVDPLSEESQQQSIAKEKIQWKPLATLVGVTELSRQRQQLKEHNIVYSL